jgi:hypothetical protein
MLALPFMVEGRMRRVVFVNLVSTVVVLARQRGRRALHQQELCT